LAQADPQNILLIHFGQLGDVVLALPAIKAVREKFAASKLTIMSGRSTAGVISLAGFADEQIAVDRVALRDGNKVRSVAEILALVKDVRGRKFDLVIDLHSLYETNLLGYFSGARERLFADRHGRSLPRLSNYPVKPRPEDRSIHHADRYLAVIEALGINGAERQVLLRPSDDAAKEAAKVIAAAGLEGKKLIGLFLGAGHRLRRWPVDRFVRTARMLAEHDDLSILVLLGPEERDLRLELDAFGELATVIQELPLDVFFALLSRLHVMATSDTGPMHLAAAAGAGIVMLSQIGAPTIFNPLASRLIVLDRTPLEEITPEMVAEAVRELAS